MKSELNASLVLSFSFIFALYLAWFAIELTEKFVKLNITTTLLAFDLTKNFVKLNTITWFAFELTEKFVKLNIATLLAFDLTKNFVKLNICWPSEARPTVYVARFCFYVLEKRATFFVHLIVLATIFVQ